MVFGCALETDVCHWMFLKKVNMVQGQEDAPLIIPDSVSFLGIENYWSFLHQDRSRKLIKVL